MNGIGGGVTVRDDQASRLVVRTPVLPVAGKAVHRIKGGGSVGVHIIGTAAEGTGEVQPDQRRGLLLIPGELQAAVGNATPVQFLTQQCGLRGLAGAVCPLKHDESALHSVPSFYAAQKFILL